MQTRRELKGQSSVSNLRSKDQSAERQRNVERSLPVAQIDFNQPISSTQDEGNRNEGNEEAFFF